MENKEILTSALIQEFLEDFEKNSTTELLEEGKEQDEIFQIADARGIKLKDRQCLAGFKTVYTFANKANLNKARLPKKDLLKALPSLVGTPIDLDHQRNYVVGHYIDYRYIVKDESVIAYGIFYKANFENEWENAKKLFKSGKLTTSYEIYSPKNKRTVLADGTFELHEMEIGGGALLFKEKPAFADAKVLEIAKANIVKEVDNLVYAMKYRCEDLIIHGEKICQKCGRCDLEKAEEKKIERTGHYFTKEELLTKKDETKSKIKCQGCGTELDYCSIPEKGMGYIECPTCKKNIDQTGKVLLQKVAVSPIAPIVAPTPAPVVAPVAPAPIVIPKIKCANCQHEFDRPQFVTSEIKCTECFAIINVNGEILYPPQIIDFNISCPSCSSRNWRLLQKDENAGQIKCLSCAKKYAIAFSKVETNELLNMVQFLHVGHVQCKQCGHYTGYSGTSQATVYNLKCIKCGLAFAHDIVKDGQVKKLSTITEITEPVKSAVSIDELNENMNIPSKADELNTDKSAIKEEAKGEVKMETKPVENIVEVVIASTPIAQPEVAEVKPEVIETVIPVVAKEEEKIVEVAKVEEIVVAPVVEVAKVEEVVVPVAEVAPVVEAKVEETPKVAEAKIEIPKAEEPKVEEAKTDEIIDASLPPEVVTLIKEYTKEGMAMKDAIKKAWMQYKKTKHVKSAKKLVKRVKDLNKEKLEIVKTLSSKIDFYKANAEEINKRRKELGDAVKGLSDEEILDNSKFSDAKLVQANLETSSIAGTKKTDEDTLNKYRKEIKDKAEGRLKRTT